MGQPMTVGKDQIVSAVEVSMGRLCAVLRSAPDPDQSAVGTWTVRDVGAHLAGGIPVYTGIVRGEPSPYSRLDRIVETNAGFVAALAERDCRVLADRIAAASGEFAAAVRAVPGDPEVTWHAGLRLPLSTVCTLMLGEALVHGYDIARACGQPWPIPGAHARLVSTGAASVLPHFVNEAASAGVRAVIDIHLRGEERARVRLAFADGALRVSSEPAGSADCHIWADPATFLLLMYGRVSPLRAALSGKAVAWGAKPWLAFTLPRLIRRV